MSIKYKENLEKNITKKIERKKFLGQKKINENNKTSKKPLGLKKYRVHIGSKKYGKRN